MKLRILMIAAVFIICQACSSSKLQAENKAKEEKPAEQKQEAHGEEEIPEIKAGDNIAEILKNVTVQDVKGKEKNLGDLIKGNSILTLVKPGCVFCESMLSVIDATKPKIKPKFIIALDKAHASFEQFKEKYESHKKIKAIWIYDHENKLHDELGLVSFPRLIHINKKHDVLEHQIGLVVPEDRASLEGMPFPLVLQKLSENTITWMQGL